MYILGLSGLAHDSAAALLGNTGILAAMEESKLGRSRRLGGIPRKAIQFCLEKVGIGWHDVPYVAVASRPVRAWARQAWLRARLTPFAPVPSGYYQSKALGELGRELNNLRVLKLMAHVPGSRVLRLEHHLCHAASAYYASPAENAIILTLDEQGDGRSGMVALGEGNRIRTLRTIPFPHSLGWVFTQVTDLLGFAPHRSEHKTQWLSLEGEPMFKDLFLEMLRPTPGALPRLHSSYFNRGLAGRIAFSKKFYRRLGIEPPASSGERQGSRGAALSETLRRQLAASVQQACATVVAELAEAYRQKTGACALCLAGGLFLNPLLVAAVEKSSGFEQVFVQPAAGNEGTALGAAWLVWHEQLGMPRLDPPPHVSWGPSYSNQEIKQVVENCKARYRWHEGEEQKIEEALRQLEAGKIIGWFQGAAEFGPRALGNRSLLASPWALYVKENLNEYVKHRETFRPFAISVAAEDCNRYFECRPSARFMATMGWVRPDALDLVKDFLLPENRVRLHVVEREANPLLWRLLKRFGEHAPAPLLVNTSFNLFGEPLVITPRDAVRSYFCSGIDALIIGNFSLTKS
ncbi:MAG: carbamoyltransferase [Acidobacteria bacterium]|nr:carbamoyltransferase [Acidobacteriota bacterium]